MAVKGLAGNAQLPAKLADDRLPLSHRCHGQAQFGGCHLVLAAALAPACAGRRQAYLGTLTNKLLFKLARAAKMPNTGISDLNPEYAVQCNRGLSQKHPVS